MVDKAHLLGLLGALDARQFRLNAIEMMGYLVLMLHWQRGIIDMLIQSGCVELDEAQKKNWGRVITNLSTYEQFCWEISPARALLPAMRRLRLDGKLPDGYEHLLVKDEHGRIPYGALNLDDIEDILRRVEDCRVADSNLRSH